MHKNNVIGGRLILEHFPEQLNFSGKNKPSIFCMWEKRRKQLAFLWRCSCAGWWKAKLERLGLRDRFAARPPAARLWWWRGPYGPRGPRMDILLNLLDHHPPFSIHSTQPEVGMCLHCAMCARTFNPVMEFLGSRPIRHTTRTCVCSFAPASTHRQIDDFGFYSKTCLFCQWWNSKATAEFFTQSLGAKCKPPFEKSQVVKLCRCASVRLLCCIYATFLADCFHYYSVPP